MTPSFLTDFSPGSSSRLAPRAYFFDDDASRVLSLNGAWEFRYGDGAWGEIPVPSCPNMHGHGTPWYTNVVFPFPVDPPHVPNDNPALHHRRAVTVPADWDGLDLILRFDGVESCFIVKLDDREIGYGKGSRLATEFDVTPYLTPGQTHRIDVIVWRWSDACYVEDQDMWWLGGIIRDVRLIARPKGGIKDIFLHADFDHLTGKGTLWVEIEGGNNPVITFLDQIVTGGWTGEVEPWTAETPRLYDVLIKTDDETITLRTGFRTVTWDDGVFRVNGRRVILKGVNRHEHDPDHGRAVPAWRMRQDLELMREAHVNAVRTSHYPPHPDFLALCDEMGIYVILENDLETHGFEAGDWEGNPPSEAVWREAILDRMTRTVERDKNHPSIVIWSLGNECGTGPNLAEIARWTQDRDPSRPVHYEGDHACEYVDIYSRMYANHAECEGIARREEPGENERRRAMPFVLCEYSHAMGNGPGGLAEYQAIIEGSERMMGAFVWEWLDHGIRLRDASGREFFAYGGDFGEPIHDGNFVMDGLVSADRVPSPAFFNLQAVFSPMRLSLDDDSLTVRNVYDFRATAESTVGWAAYDACGAELGRGMIAVPALDAGEAVTLPLRGGGVPPPLDAAILTVHGFGGAYAELVRDVTLPIQKGGRHAPPTFDADGRLRRVGEFPLKGPFLDLYRAPTDNDIGGPQVARQWKEAGLHRLQDRVASTEETPAGGRIVKGRLAPPAKRFAMDYTLTMEPDGDGLIVTVDVAPYGEWPCVLPRLGVRFELPRQLDDARWFGRDRETYRDTLAGAALGIHSSDVLGLQTPYARPQENGQRMDCRFLELTDRGEGLRIEGGFDFTVRPWSTAALAAARHPHELVDEGVLHLHIDHAHHGIGSASCGAPPLPPYDLHAKAARFAFRLSPTVL